MTPQSRDIANTNHGTQAILIIIYTIQVVLSVSLSSTFLMLLLVSSLVYIMEIICILRRV